MLFHDPSCRAEVTLKENHAMGMYRLCQLDWVAICTKTNQGAIYIDAQRDETGAAGDIPQRFLDQYGHELTCDDGMQLFQMEDCYFRKIPIRRDASYSVFALYCRKGEDISPANLEWLQICSELKYAYTLLNNESIQERDLSENIVDSIESAIVVLDLTGKVVSCNGNIRHMFGIGVNTLLSRNFLTCINPACRDAFSECFQRITQLGQRQLLGDIVLFPNTDRIVNATLSPLRNSKGHLVGGVLVGNDVTSLRSMEHELQQSKQFSLLGQISAGLAHDVKNPLMIINGCAGALLRNGGLSPEHQELLNIILHESGRINNVIEQMLSFGNISVSRKPSAMNLNDVLDNCVRIINRQKNGKQIDMDVALDPSIPTLIADNGGLQQAFLNVLINSVEAIQTSGTIRVCSRRLPRTAQVSIQDTGCGIPPEKIDHLFKPYYSTKARNGGSGLGLFVAKRVFDQSKAIVSITSEQNIGTTVTVTFPLPEPLPAEGEECHGI